MDATATIDFLNDVKSKLRRSASDLSKWKLYNSARWSSEAILGMCDITDLSTVNPYMEDDESPLKGRKGIPDPENNRRNSDDLDNMTGKEYDLYLLASTLFDCKEFDRCAYYLTDADHPCLKFLQLYSKYLSWDKKTQENLESTLALGKSRGGEDDGNDIDGKIANNAGLKRCDIDSDTNNKSQKIIDIGNGDTTSISILIKDLNKFLELHDSDTSLGTALLYYLRGILYKSQDINSTAMTSFLKSVTLYPHNWACWWELLNCLARPDESLLLLKLLNEKFGMDQHNSGSTSGQIMLRFFKLSLFQEFSGNIDDFIEELDYLLNIFPNFAFLKTQHALINYHYMDYVNSELIFDQIIKLDPYRLDDLDVYSNILYVMQKSSKLAYLAQFASGVDRYRPESCCIVANYYSAKQEHEKSIMYFRRALTLNKSCTSAWTLMGHEFVELKNSHAAIECYRRAVDINSRDFKAWYGLGQAYEVLDMHLYSLYYFQKACSLKPLDKRMWQALASCYEKIGNSEESIKCYVRALQLSINSDQDTSILYRLALLYEKLKDSENCENYMVKCVEAEQSSDGLVTDETTKARLWLARYQAKHKKFAEAYNYALGVTHGTSQEIEEARSIARECRRRME
ncbi:LAFE_0H01024g1_1 [Lachancea fermentati]|uniref:LAFE_0H01024g1_1 n=1 Tax=Lachancea fermentati TaxID=4955 RepID=A0A1G4MJ22_LACFM|nr:LAFE_0H01024g1_1 [Lachancea fermentati]